MLLHFRLTVPSDLTKEVRQLLVDSDHAINVTVHEGAAVDPSGDLVEADVAREGAGPLMHDLERTSLPDRGGIVILAPVGTPFAGAERLERASAGHPDDAVIWDRLRVAHSNGCARRVARLSDSTFRQPARGNGGVDRSAEIFRRG